MNFDLDSSVQELEAASPAAQPSAADVAEAPAAPEPASEASSELAGPAEPAAPLQPPPETPPLSPLQRILRHHQAWLDSAGRAGQQANFCRARISGPEFTDACLRQAILNQADLDGADLLLADFSGASMMQASLRGANLLGAKFHDANLQGASMQGAAGLQAEHLSGANLFGAALPEDCPVAGGLRGLKALGKSCQWALCAVSLLCLAFVLRIVTTSDAQLLANAPVLPLDGLRDSLRLIPFYLCAPVALLGVYAGLQLCLQRLWDAAARQPAIFPDGSRLDSHLLWFARWPARIGMKWLREHSSPLACLEAAVSLWLLHGLVPATLVLFWARYLTLQDLRGTLLHVLCVATAVFAAQFFARAAKRSYRVPLASATPAQIWIRRSVAPAVGVALLLLSVGVMDGTPHDSGAGKQSSRSIGSWAPALLWWAGYSPAAQLSEAEVSMRADRPNGRAGDLDGVEGARLNGAQLRYLQAYAAFFAKARLWQADLSHANLAEADLREANLRQAILDYADLDHARLSRAVLQQASLLHANLNQCDLQNANLSRVAASHAQFIDAKLDAANLYGADLAGALLRRASLPGADLRDANLESADLTAAVLHQTYLSSAKLAGARLESAQLSGAFLTQAELQKANLQGAVLQGAMLNGANLAGANLQNADFRGALGLTAAQVCSAASLAQIQLDQNLQNQAESLCNLNR